MNMGEPADGAQVEVEGGPEEVFAFLTGATDARSRVSVGGPDEAVRRLRALTRRSPVSIHLG